MVRRCTATVAVKSETSSAKPSLEEILSSSTKPLKPHYCTIFKKYLYYHCVYTLHLFDSFIFVMLSRCRVAFLKPGPALNHDRLTYSLCRSFPSNMSLVCRHQPFLCRRHMSSMLQQHPSNRLSQLDFVSRSESSASRSSDPWALDLSGDMDSTIFAACSGPLRQRSGIAVVRVSGPHAKSILLKITSRKSCPRARMATLCSLVHPSTNENIDSQALAILFTAPNSFTGEDVVEFHVHGSPVVVTHLLDALQSCARHLDINVRSASPGEFTRRALQV